MQKIMNNFEFCRRLEKVLEYKTSYMLGSFGHITSETNIKREVDRKDVNNKRYEDGARSILNKGFMFDCCGLIKGISWGFNYDLTKIYGGAVYKLNGVNDYGADTLINISEDVSKDFTGILPGEAVWMSGHIGVYLGNGKVIESTPRWSVCPGVKITMLGNLGYKGDKVRSWTKHGKLPWINYIAEEKKEDKESENVVIYNKISECPEWSKEAIQWFSCNGYLAGTPKGLDLDYNMCRILTILYRALKKE